MLNVAPRLNVARVQAGAFRISSFRISSFLIRHSSFVIHHSSLSMPSLTDQLQHRAVEFAKSFNFGPDALATNLELTRVAPSNEGAWTRLARCYMESGQLDEAAAALDAALAVNPQSTIARNLHLEVTKRRAGAMAVVDAPRARASRARRTTESARAAPSG